MLEKPGDLFKTADAAATDFGKYYNGTSIINNKEYASSIYTVQTESGTMYTYTPAAEGTESSSTASVMSGSTVVATAHTHADYTDAAADKFSGADIKGYKADKLPGYVATPDGSVKKYDVKTDKVTTISTDAPSSSADPNRKNDISPITGNSAKKDLAPPPTPTAKQDAIPKMPPPPEVKPIKNPPQQ